VGRKEREREKEKFHSEKEKGDKDRRKRETKERCKREILTGIRYAIENPKQRSKSERERRRI